MAVGMTASTQSLNAQLGQAALALRNAMQRCNDLVTFTNNQGLAGLENTAGFVPNDATAYTNMTSYLSTLTGIYYGTVQQGGSNGTAATMFNFDNALSTLWGGQ